VSGAFGVERDLAGSPVSRCEARLTAGSGDGFPGYDSGVDLSCDGVRDLTLEKKGHSGNADIFSGCLDGRPVIVKDFRQKAWLVRWFLWPYSVWRETRRYLALLDVPGIPALRGFDARRLVVDRIDGRPLAETLRGEVGEATFPELSGLISEIHRRGIVHLDLAHRGNILVDREGHPWLIDLASAVSFRLAGPLKGPLASLVGFFDRAAVAKWKCLLSETPLSLREQRDLDRLFALARFWLFNRKRSQNPTKASEFPSKPPDRDRRI